MRIDISNSPYYPEFKSGYLINDKKEGRRYVVLVRNDQTKSCTSYARFLMSVKLGRRLLKEEQVDHIDEDRSNDSIDNLQIMTQRNNISKNARFRFGERHGTSSMYRRGCRCDKCRDYAKAVRNKWYERHREELKMKRREKREKGQLAQLDRAAFS